MRPMSTLLLALAPIACARAPAGESARPQANAPTDSATPGEADVGSARLGDLGGWIRERIAQEAPDEVAVALVDLASDARVAVNADVSMHAASTMKVPVMLELFRQADAGRFSLAEPIEVSNEFTSIADGSRYSLSPEDDSDPALYELVGETVILRDLIRRMITRSSNLATNILIERATPDSIQATMRELDAAGMRVLRGVEDIPAYRRGMNNTTTALAFARVLEAIARCAEGESREAALRPLTRASCREMVDILAGQEFNDMIPAGLPPGTRVAHKTGWITEIQHDGGIVYPRGRPPYVLVVLTRGIADTTAAAQVAADISRRSWQQLVEGVAMARAAPAAEGRDRAPWVPDESAGDAAAAGVSAELAALADRYRVAAITEREFTHGELWDAIGPVIDQAPGLAREEIGRSAEDRPIYLVHYGNGPTRALLWSQMHGDESTATMALADILRFLAEAPDHPRAQRLAERLTVLLIPMLNPDGAERFQRRNALGIDVNRDARRLSTPEGRALKAMQERFRPEFGFNLHDQNVRTRVGQSDRLAAIALLAPAFNEARDIDDGRMRAYHLAAAVRNAIEPLVGGHIARYDDTFNPRAFGDLMQQWGVSTVLIESGGWQDDPEKQYLRKVNVVAILSALDAIATGSYMATDTARYTSLPENGRSVYDLLVVGGTLVAPGDLPDYRTDLAINFDEPLERRDGRIVDMGDLGGGFDARDTLDVSGLFLHPAPDMVARPEDTSPILAPDQPASFTVRRGADPGSETVWLVTDGVARSPDASTSESRAAPPLEPARSGSRRSR